jgi:hypothetical protein
MLHCERFQQGQAGRAEGSSETERYLAIRVRLQIGHRTRELALFNLAIDSKLVALPVANRPTTASRACIWDFHLADFESGGAVLSKFSAISA